ncbi:hypothetical protein GGI22_006638 [Coemansia erecta]|nr:hypothetical protein GGI22_006638 [Coemansia erecta]
MKKKLAAQFAAMNQKDVSRACGLMWRSEPEHVKMRYRQSYNKEKRNFERLCTTSAVEPSEEALSALASVMASSVKVTTTAASAKNRKHSASPKIASTASIMMSPASASGLDKKRRLTDGCQSAPASPPEQRAIDSSHDLLMQARAAKRPRTFYASPRSHSMSSGTSSPIHIGVGLASIKEVAYGGIEGNFPAARNNSNNGISLPSCASLLSLADSATSLASRMPPTTTMYQQQQQQESSSPRRTSFGDAFPPRASAPAYAHKRQQSMHPVPQPHQAYDYAHYAQPPHQYTKQPVYLEQQPPRRVCAISTPSYFHSQLSNTRHSPSRPHMPSRQQMPLPPSSSYYADQR